MSSVLVEEPKTLRKRDVPLMYCGRCGSPLKQFGALTRRRHAARCDYDRERNFAALSDPERRAKMFTTLGESAMDVMATILGLKPRVRAVWFENVLDSPPQASTLDQNS
jgi:hypothetical protein